MTSQTERTVTQAKRRAQAVGGAVAGLVVVLALLTVYFVATHDKSDKSVAAPVAQTSALPEATDTAAAADPNAADPNAADPNAAASSAAPVDIPAALSKEPVVKAGTGTVAKLKVTPLVQGTGAVVKSGQTITVNYVVVTYKDGKTLDSSWSRNQTFDTAIGVGQVIKGWDEAIPGQKLGSRLQIDVPAALAYGAQQGDLRFVVDLLAAK